MTRLGLVLVSVGALSACGGSKVHHLADGGADAPEMVDARQIDGREIDASTEGAVTIAVTFEGAVAPGATVYFQNADSTVVAEALTGSDGTATQVMAAGGFVTLIEPQGPAVANPPDVTGTPIVPSDQQVDTFADVKPGDVLHVDIDDETDETAIGFALTVPTDGSATEYEVFASCGEAFFEATGVELGSGSGSGSGSGQTTNVTFFGCNGVADMLVETFGEDAPLNSLFAPGVSVANGSAVSLTGTYTPIGNQVVVAINIPAAVNPNQIESDGETLFASHGLLQDFGDVNEAQQNNAALFDYVQPAVPLVALEEEEFDGQGSALLDDQEIGDWGSASFTTVILDATAERLPDFTDAPAFDIPSEQVQFTVSGGSASVDGTDTTVAFSRTVLDDDTSTDATWNWYIVTPGTEVGAIQYPTLPTDLFAWNGSAGDDTTVDFTELGHVTGGYDAVRAQLYDFDFDGIAATTPTGHVVMEYFDAHSAVEDVARAVKWPSRRLRQRAHAHGHARAWRTKR